MKILGLIFFILMSTSILAESRLKDIVSIKGYRDNPLIGYGLVIGLNGTGDGEAEITQTSLKRMLKKLGLNPKKDLSSKNVAAVIVTAKLQPFARVGQKIDVTVSSIGDSSSLAGGTLIMTPLKGTDSKIYAVAHGPVSIGGLVKGSDFATTGKIPNGGTIEKEFEVNFDRKKNIRLSLNIPDFTTSARIEKIINRQLGGKFAKARDATTVDLTIPPHYERDIVKLMAIIENFKINTDQKASIIINERTGTIIAGGDVVLKKAAIGHGDLSIEVGGKSLHLINEGTSLNDLVKALNLLGAASEDFISILQALKANGSLIGELIFI